MVKNLRLKIILVFLAIGILTITLYGVTFICELKKIQMDIMEVQYQQLINSEVSQIAFSIFMAIAIYTLLAIVVGTIAMKIIIAPIEKILKNAEKIAAGEIIDIRYLTSEKEDAEVGDLVKAFNLMTTELQENLNEASRQKKQIETILLHMTDGIIAFDIEGKILHINPAATRLLRLTPSDNTFDKIFKQLNVKVNLEKIIYLENWTSYEQRINVQEKFVNLYFAPFTNENDRPSGVIVVIQDITEHVKLDNMRKEFVANVSHELKTPITSIMGYADTLAESEYDKQTQDKFLGVIASEARRMARLVSDLLTLSRYDNNEAKWEKTEFDLGELVKKCIDSQKIEINKKNQHMECFVTANVPLVNADKYGIERVILNILTNSIKYTKEGGTIKVYVGFVYNDAYIKIIDNGIGIPEEDLTKIFERFYRVDKARTREMGGTGLGLPIAKEILDKNNGSIDIKSKVGEGTEVVIRVPTK